MQAPHLSLLDLLGLNVRTYHDLGQVADSAARVVAQEDLTDEERVKVNIILGYVSAKTGKWHVAAHHYMSAFNASRVNKLDAHLVMTSGMGVVLAVMAQKDYSRARQLVKLLEAAVDSHPDATTIDRVMLDLFVDQTVWRLADVS